MASFVLSLLLLQVTVPVTTAPSAPPGWTAAPLGAHQVDHFTRTESDGSVSTLYVHRIVCSSCQPDGMNGPIERAFRQYTGVVMTLDAPQICGQKASRLIVTGVPPASGMENMVRISFRSGDALITQTYAFSQPQPAADAVTTLESLCP